MVNPDFHIYPLSEKAVTVSFGNEIDGQLLQQVSRLNELINNNPFTGFCTTVPAYATLSVFFDPLQVILSPDLPGDDCFEKVSGYLTMLNSRTVVATALPQNCVTIPVCYGGIFGPDIEDVAAMHGLTIERVITLHSSVTYRVFMIGFVPGFAYLGGLPPELEMPRRQTPRDVVPAGSVGIAGKQTGIYPMQTPGGWQLIGRTPVKLFDVHRKQPSLLQANDKVVFKPIDEHEFNRLAQQ